MLSPVTFTIAGQEVGVDGWTFNDGDGGHDQCSGVMSEADYRKAGNPTQGATVAAWVGTTCIWAGRFAAPPQIKEGRAYFNAVGYKEEAEKQTKRLFIMSADTSIWVPYDSDPHLDSSGNPVYGHSRKWLIETTRGGIRAGLTKDQGLATNDAATVIFYAEGIELRQIHYWMNWDTADNFAKLEVNVKYANGPTGSSTSFATDNFGSGNRGTEQTHSHAVSGQDEMILQFNCNDGTFTPNSQKMNWLFTKLWVWSNITSATTYNASDVMSYIAGQLGWDAAGVDASTYDILPFDWDGGSWMDAMRYVAELEDRYVRVGAPTSTGPRLDYDDWGSTNWTVYQSDGANADLKPLELFNQARVWYDTSAGVRRSVLASASPDPLASSGITNIYEYDLEDSQKDNALATAVAAKLAARESQQLYSGQIEVVSATSSDGRTDPRFIRYGDTVTIADWGSAANQTLRVMEVSQDFDSVSLGVEQPINLVALLEHTQRPRNRRHHRRRRRKMTGGGHADW